MENTPPQQKRGRGRPRKTAVAAPIIEDFAEENTAVYLRSTEPEEILMPPHRVDIDDLRASVPPAATPQPEEVETIYMGAQPDPQPSPPPRISPDVPEMLRAPSMQASPPSPPTDDKAKRRELLAKVRKYRESFPAVAAMHFNPDWGTEELDAHLESIRVAVSAKTTGLLVKSAYLMGVKGFEVGGTAVGLKVYGLSDLLSRSAEVDSILKEIQCELPVLGHIGPGHRLALATFGAALALDSANRKAEVLGQFKAAPVNEAVSQKYGDL